MDTWGRLVGVVVVEETRIPEVGAVIPMVVEASMGHRRLMIILVKEDTVVTKMVRVRMWIVLVGTLRVGWVVILVLEVAYVVTTGHNTQIPAV
jgi:glycyl-tRNA synthetase (class II)